MTDNVRLNVLIVCGQGTYDNGCYYTEFADRDVYLEHAITVRKIVDKFRYDLVVCSGGRTQRETPGRSEAQSFLAMWEDTDSAPTWSGGVPNELRIVLDEVALDSAENLYWGLTAARMGLLETENLALVPFRRIGLFAAWSFKKQRFVRTAEALGIGRRFYFHGLAPASRAFAAEKAQQGEQKQFERMATGSDFLLFGQEWEDKRLLRFVRGNRDSADYYKRLSAIESEFPDFIKAYKDHNIIAFRGEFLGGVVKASARLAPCRP